MASSRRSGSAAAALLFLPLSLVAQAPGSLPLMGRVVRVRGADTAAVARAVVVAHRISPSRQGPIDSVRADAAGRFRFTVAAPDTGAAYVVSTGYQGIGYFSEPFSTRERAGSDKVTLAVYDTSSAGPPITVGVRHVVLTAPDSDGARRVLDIAQVTNPGTTTRVGADSLAATWRIRIPDGIEDVRPGAGDVSPSAVRVGAGVVSVTAPLPPGEKQVVLMYVLPRGRRTLRLPIDQPTAHLELLVEDSAATVTGGAQAADPVTLEGRTFRRFVAESLASGAAAELRLSVGRGPEQYWWLAVALSALALAGGAAAAARRRGPAGAPAPAPVAADVLIARLAALDERYQGRESETSPAQWARYQARRAALKSELAARLAQR